MAEEKNIGINHFLLVLHNVQMTFKQTSKSTESQVLFHVFFLVVIFN